MPRTLLLAFLLLSACQSVELAPAPKPFADAWASSPDRPWPGRDWYANRVQDWRVRDGRAECIYGGDRQAGRVQSVISARA